jgi:predicted MPP superfamily phosphohydrolase
VIIVQVVILFGPIDFIFFVIKNLKKQLSPRLESLLLKFLIYLSIFFVAYIPLRSYYEFKNVTVEKRIYNLKTNKKDLNNFRIAFFSDIQMDRFTNEKRVKHFIDELNKLNADIVLAGGDFITGDSNYIPIVASLVKNINSKYGTFSAIGDHDFFGFKKQYWRSIEEVKKALKANDVNMVDDGNVFFFINESSIKVTFLSNTYVKSYNEKTFDSLAQNNSNFDLKILVSHQPDEKIAIKAKNFGYNLYLAGHTHGGQVNFIFPFIKLTPVILETKFISGDFWFDDLLMIVNRGLGMSNMPIRFNSMPEISLIEIQTAHN